MFQIKYLDRINLMSVLPDIMYFSLIFKYKLWSDEKYHNILNTYHINAIELNKCKSSHYTKTSSNIGISYEDIAELFYKHLDKYVLADTIEELCDLAEQHLYKCYTTNELRFYEYMKDFNELRKVE